MLDHLGFFGRPNLRFFGATPGVEVSGLLPTGWALLDDNSCEQTGQLSDWAGQLMVR